MEATLMLANKSELERMAGTWPKAACRALNKTNAQIFTLVKKTIRNRYNAPASKLNTRFKLARATPANLAVGIHATGRPLSLAYFAARWRKSTGVSVEVVRGKRKMMVGRFISTMASGHKGVFERGTQGARRIKRTSPATGKGYLSHMPIVEKYTISVGEMMIATKVQSVVNEFVNVKLPEILAHEIDFEASQ